MLTKCSEKQARYLYWKWSTGAITQNMIERIFDEDCCVRDIYGGYFLDFFYEDVFYGC